MVARVVRLGSERIPGEGLRIGTVRRPPRGVAKAEFAAQNWYDVWLPNLAPSVGTVKSAQTATTDKERNRGTISGGTIRSAEQNWGTEAPSVGRRALLTLSHR